MEDKNALLKVGEKVHIVTRRLFENDLRRHFAGEVAAVTDRGALVVGYAFVFDVSRNEYVRKPGPRTRVFGILEAEHIINVLPPMTDIAALHYEHKGDRGLVVTDDRNFFLDVNEFGANR